jgi:hypothetical protein
MKSRIKDLLYNMSLFDANQMTNYGRFDKVSDINELWVQFNAGKITRIEFLRRYANILERD